jgi:hypothetical protein
MEFNNDFLLTQIKNQVEFYFAPQNLQNDKFLQSQLNATDHLGAVSIHVICSFRKIRQLYSYSRSGYYPHDVDMPADPALLRMALATSSVVSISHDGMWIVPNLQKDPQKDSSTEATVASVPSSPSSSQDGSFQQDRSTIILREIANTVTEAMVLEAFAKFNPKAARMEGDTWHLVFGSPEDASASLEAGIKLDGKPVEGSLKSDMSNVPALPLPPPAAPQAQVIGNPNVMGYQGQFAVHPPPQYNYVPVHYGMPQMLPQYPVQPQYFPQPQYRYFSPNGQQRQPGGPPPQNVFVRPANENNRMKRRNNGNKRRNRRQQQQPNQQQQEDKPSRKESNRNNNNKKNQEKKKEVVKEIDLSQEHFPSLGGKESTKSVSTNVTGYAQALKKTRTTTPPNAEPVEQALDKMTVVDETK